jgi:hypothetical protein
MSRYDREPSTITVQPLDLTPLYPSALDYLNAHRAVDGKPKVTEIEASPRWGIVETSHGLYALCTEGVGPGKPISHTNPLEVDLFVRRTEDQDPKREFISIAPACSVSLDAVELRGYTSGDPVPLHEWIRSFGGRLEANYSSWRRRSKPRRSSWGPARGLC